MNAEIWNVLHDGSIVGVSGSVPGDIQFAIWIDYLRARFSDSGNRILLTLHGCNSLSFQPYEAEMALVDLDAIAKAEPEILQAHDWTDPSTIDCVGGTLYISATDFSLALDSGRDISFDELCAVSEAYWNAFGKAALAPRVDENESQ